MTERLRLPAMLTLCLGSFPIWHWLCGGQGLPGRVKFGCLTAALLLCAGAYLHHRLDAPLRARSLLLAGLAARGVAVLAGVGGGLLLHLWMSLAGAVTAGILFYVLYVIFWQISRLPVQSLLSVYSFVLIGTVGFIGQILCFLQNRTSLGAVCLWMLAATAMLFVLLRNLHMLLETGAGRDMPQGYFTHNLLLIGGFLLPGVVLMATGGMLLERFRRFLAWFWEKLVWLIRSVAVLMLGEDLIGEPMEKMEQHPAELTASPWIGAVITLVVTGVVLFMLVRFRAELWDFLCQCVEDLLGTLRRLARRREPAVTVQVCEEYTDRSELLETTHSHRPTKAASYRAALRQYRRERDPAQRYRKGYALWMRRLQMWEAQLSAQDTPQTILERSSGIPEPALTGRITEVYYKVRYGGYAPTLEELSEMDRLVRLLK